MIDGKRLIGVRSNEDEDRRHDDNHERRACGEDRVADPLTTAATFAIFPAYAAASHRLSPMPGQATCEALCAEMWMRSVLPVDTLSGGPSRHRTPLLSAT